MCGDVCLADPKARAFQLKGWNIHGNLQESVSSKTYAKGSKIAWLQLWTRTSHGCLAIHLVSNAERREGTFSDSASLNLAHILAAPANRLLAS
jgi:hypothetical protein